MNTHYPSKPKNRWMARGLLILLTILPVLALAVSLASAGRNAKWSASELQLQNISTQPQPVMLTWYNASGAPALQIPDVLPARQGDFYIPTLPTNFTGTVHVETPGQVLGVVTHLDDNPPGAAQWPLVDDAYSTNAGYVPYFGKLPPDQPSSRITIHNLETWTVTVSATFFYPNGTPAHGEGGAIGPLAALTLDAMSMTGLAPGEYSVIVQASGRILVSIDRTDNVAAFSSAQAPARGGHKIAAPVFMVEHEDLYNCMASQAAGHAPDDCASVDLLTSVLAMQNAASLTTTGVLSYYENLTGILLATQPFTVAPYATFQWSGSTTLIGTFGQVVATADQPIAGLVLGRGIDPSSADLWDYTAVVIEPWQPDTLDRRTAYGPAVYSNYLNGWNSRTVIANLSDAPALVSVIYSSAPTGMITTTILPLLRHALGILSPILPPGFEHASVRIKSNQPVAAVVWSVNKQLSSGLDRYMAYEMQYAPYSANQAPYTPSNPDPANGATSVPVTQTLSWQGGDPDGDPVMYTIAFGAVNPPPIMATNVTTPSYEPSGLITATTYYWAITATDGISMTTGPVWSFTTIVILPPNQAPYTPFDPVPADDMTGVPVTQVLSWQGGDPDGDPVTYTVAFGTADPPPVVATDVATSSYNPGRLITNTTYYWVITATDGISMTAGPTWRFTTATTLPPNQAPYTPSNPDPANGATSVPVTQTLSWQGGDPDGDPVTYTVAFGTADPPPVVATNVATPSYSPSGLITGTTYYWVITATDGISLTVGPVWSFDTIMSGDQFFVYLPVVMRN